MDFKLRPARDLGLAPGERMRSLKRESGLFGTVTSGLWRRATRLYLRLAHRLEVVGRENLPAAPPYVLIANHSSHLDALTLAALPRGEAARGVRALAAGDVFFGSGRTTAFAAYAINALPVWRGRMKRGDLATLRQRLVEDGLVYIIFPEGTRSRTGEMGEFQAGLAMLVGGTGVPVVPCHVSGAFEAWPAARRFPRPGRVRVRIGPALDFSAVANDRAGGLSLAQACQKAVEDLR
ncbi:MAG: 1-acyl-sn-glycerol-3-phosphate acyltransferase [Rubritepida sp.]|nr:1-acyl-sn-glycerol-3-phosphate acyltransferase [Rubritepida sp.]